MEYTEQQRRTNGDKWHRWPHQAQQDVLARSQSCGAAAGPPKAARESEAEATQAVKTADRCFAALLHGNADSFFVYACILGRRLREYSAGPDRVLLCGPGRCSNDAAARRALRTAGWQRFVSIEPITAAHLDKTCRKRHALVFSKLRALELPYAKVLLLDLDLLPRDGVDMGKLFQVAAPAGKYHGLSAEDRGLAHGEPIPAWLRKRKTWCPNAGVLRLDPLPALTDRIADVESMVAEIHRRSGASYLPEQYYLADRLQGWRHIDKAWNWEICPEMDDPGITYPIDKACCEAKQFGWASLYLDVWGQGDTPTAATVLRDVLVWHFSGTSSERTPWLLLDLPGAAAVRHEVERRFQARDPGGIVASSLAEWRTAYDALLAEAKAGHGWDALRYLREAARRLSMEAARYRRTKVRWTCAGCGAAQDHVREITDLPVASLSCATNPFHGIRWACRECIVRRLRPRVCREKRKYHDASQLVGNGRKQRRNNQGTAKGHNDNSAAYCKSGGANIM